MDNAAGTTQGQPKGGSLRSPSSKKDDRRPTPDQMFLAAKLNGDGLWTFAEEVPQERSSITPAALQRWNNVYGVVRTTEALRVAWGFPPLGGIENPYSYVEAIIRGKQP